MDEATKDEKARLGAEIRRVRERRPKISRQRVADEAQVAEGTVRAVERGASIDHSTRRVMEALARLGRPVEPTPADDTAANGAGEGPDHARRVSTEGLNEVELTVRLVESTLNASPPEERNVLESNIWLLIRGRNAELIERLSASAPE
ncbi:hypothetical protein GCM10027053_11120 [Intrasporangium mesophilum]